MRPGADPRTTPTADGARLLARQVPAEERPDTVRHDLAHLSLVEWHGPTEGALLNFRADQYHERVRRALGLGESQPSLGLHLLEQLRQLAAHPPGTGFLPWLQCGRRDGR